MTKLSTAAESIAQAKAQGSYEAAVEAAHAAPPMPPEVLTQLRDMGLRATDRVAS